jgi:hypothetical protein
LRVIWSLAARYATFEKPAFTERLEEFIIIFFSFYLFLLFRILIPLQFTTNIGVIGASCPSMVGSSSLAGNIQ